MKIKIPKSVREILQRLNSNGFCSYVVGGCIRDSLLNKSPKDWDVCTNAKPEEIKAVFYGEKIIDTGIKHGTVTLVKNSMPYEITTFRVDGKYSDGRRPEKVNFTDDLREDLMRRDFTVNALVADENGEIIDLVNGIRDLSDGIIRAIGNPADRFNEDGLRILRAMRFAAKYDFKIANCTSEAMHQCKENLLKISKERINTEFTQFIRFTTKQLLLEYSDIISVFIPDIKNCIGFNQNNPYHIYDVYEHSVTAVDSAIFDPIMRLALFFHDIGKPFSYTEDEKHIGHFYGHSVVSAKMTEEIMKTLRFDNSTIDKVVELVKYHDLTIKPDEIFARKMLNKYGFEQANRLIDVMRADKLAQNKTDEREQFLWDTVILSKFLDDEFENKTNCIQIKDLAINGNDLKIIGYKEGKSIGDVLQRCLVEVIEHPELNTKETLMQIAKECYETENDKKIKKSP